MADNTGKDPKDWVSGDDPMTEAQGVLSQDPGRTGHKPDPTEQELTKAEASQLIDRLREKARIDKN